jgi:DNA-binding HxlR family transcriptional regulator
MLAAFLMNQASEMWGKKWRSAIIWNLREGPLRFSEIKKTLNGISVKVLSETLKNLMSKGLIVRKQYNTIPVKVTYELHEDTKPLIEAQDLYIKNLMAYFYKHRTDYDFPDWVLEALEKEQLVSNQ